MAINNVDRFLERINGFDNVLLGNGFVLSHPDFENTMHWDYKMAIKDKSEDILSSNVNTLNPEKGLSDIRINIIRSILRFYVNKFIKEFTPDGEDNLNKVFQQYNSNEWTCFRFLSKYRNIFSLNYDPLTYLEVISLNKNTSKEKKFIDGFFSKGCGFISQEDICKFLKESNENKVYYMYCSWFILINSESQLRKLSFGKKSIDNVKSIFENEKTRPHIILEDKWRVKEELLRCGEDKYLNYCYDALGKL